MKKISLVILAVLLALTTVLSASCAAPPEENAGNGNNVGNGGSAEGTDESTEPPEETEPESTADEGTEKEEESALPENTDSSNEDTDTDAPQETEPIDEKHLKAIEALTVLDEDTENAIHEAIGGELTWLDYEKIVTDRGYAADACCYGEYNGYVIFIFRTPLEAEMTMVIGNYEFHEPNYFNFFAFRNGTLYSLEELYSNGIITNADFESIVENYKIFCGVW